MPADPFHKPDVLIVGAGLSGLAAALHLEHAGLSCLLLEASDDIGGRVRTDILPGPGGDYRLDRGFQIFLSAYPEGQSVLDYPALEFGKFTPGARIWTGDAFTRISDPRRDGHWLGNALAPIGTPLDKLRAAKLILPLLRGNPLDLLPSASTDDPRRQTTRAYLISCGFSDLMFRRFWDPFLSGVLLDPSLSASAGFTLFTLRMFATGDAVLPARGIAEIPRQLAAKLTRSAIRLRSPVADVSPGQVLLCSGERLHARATLLATDDPAARNLLSLPARPSTGSTCTLYFAAPQSPVPEPILVLDGERTGPINHLAVVSSVAPAVAPLGWHLISLSTIGLPALSSADLVRDAVAQMTRWFGPQVRSWQFLRCYRIGHALPDASPAARPGPWTLPSKLLPGLYRASDALNSPSSQGAFSSARLAASAILKDLH